MSHFTKVTTKITDITALENALTNMGLKLDHNVDCRYFSGKQQRQLVAKLNGPYDIAFEKNNDGTYSIDADFWNGHVEKVIGAKGVTLKRQYTIEKLKIEARKKHLGLHDFHNGKFKIYDTTDTTGAFVEATVDESGNIFFKAKGFAGKSCMSYSSLEDAFGETQRKMTEDFHRTEKRVEVEVNKTKG